MKLDLNIKQLRLALQTAEKLARKHGGFAALILVLMVYISMVWQISRLATAEPSATDQQSAAQHFPKVDQTAIKQIQDLEQNNIQVHSLFNQARNNPFQE